MLYLLCFDIVPHSTAFKISPRSFACNAVSIFLSFQGTIFFHQISITDPCDFHINFKSSSTSVCCLFYVLLLLEYITDLMLDLSLQVQVYVNKVGPYFNPPETYHYYQLPVCRPEQVRQGV